MFIHYICIMDTDNIWDTIVKKHKWYAGIVSDSGAFYSEQAAYNLKRRYKNGTLSLRILERIFNAHGYYLEKRWVSRCPVENAGRRDQSL